MIMRPCLRIAAPLLLITSTASAQLETPCVPNSPERRGQLGCSVVETKLLPTSLAKSLYWHLDLFDTGERTRAAVTPVDGEQCLEQATRADTMRKGDGLAVPGGVPMRLVAIGDGPRRALAVIVHDASKPPTTRLKNPPRLVRCL